MSYVFLAFEYSSFVEICKGQVQRANGPTQMNIEKPKDLNEVIDVEKPKRETAPVQRLGQE